MIPALLLACMDPGKESGFESGPMDSRGESATTESTPMESSTGSPGPDADGDGFDAPEDCDDADPGSHPGAEDVPDDGVDQDCDGIDACVVDNLYPGYVSIDSDADVATYLDLCDAGWDAVRGIDIHNCSIEDLSFLWCVCAIDPDGYGGSTIFVQIQDNPNLTSLAGLEHLREVDWLDIGYNASLTDISALSQLESVGYFALRDMPVTSLEPLSGLTDWDRLAEDGSENDYVSFSGLQVSDLRGLTGMTSIPDLAISNLPDLTSLAGLDNLVVVSDGLSAGSTGVSSLEGLDALESVPNLQVGRNDDLVEAGPLASLRHAGFNIRENALLDSFSTPPALETLAFLRTSGPSLLFVSASPLSGEVDGELRVLDSPLLTDLTGLSPLTAVGGDLEVSGNDTLLSLDGLQNLEWIGGDVILTDNPLLPQSEIDSFLEAVGLENIAGTVTVSGNGA